MNLDVRLVEKALLEAAKKGWVVPRTENNPYLKMAFKGSGPIISDKWNVAVYNNGSIRCVDKSLLADLVAGKVGEPDKKKICMSIDDAGYGFPLCGAMIGISDGSRVETDTIHVKYFQEPHFSNKAYTSMYAAAGLRLLETKFNDVHPSTHRIEICSGYINSSLRESLRRTFSFDVRIVEIKGLLQDELENRFREYVKNYLGEDLAYDPKGMDQGEIAFRYKQAVEWGTKNAPQLLKTGWTALKDSTGPH